MIERWWISKVDFDTAIVGPRTAGIEVVALADYDRVVADLAAAKHALTTIGGSADGLVDAALQGPMAQLAAMQLDEREAT